GQGVRPGGSAAPCPVHHPMGRTACFPGDSRRPQPLATDFVRLLREPLFGRVAGPTRPVACAWSRWSVVPTPAPCPRRRGPGYGWIRAPNFDTPRPSRQGSDVTLNRLTVDCEFGIGSGRAVAGEARPDTPGPGQGPCEAA